MVRKSGNTGLSNCFHWFVCPSSDLPFITFFTSSSNLFLRRVEQEETLLHMRITVQQQMAKFHCAFPIMTQSLPTGIYCDQKTYSERFYVQKRDTESTRVHELRKSSSSNDLLFCYFLKSSPIPKPTTISFQAMFLYNVLCAFYYVLFYVTSLCFLLHPCRDPSTVATMFNLSQNCFNLLSCFKSTVFCSNLWTCVLTRIVHLLFPSLRIAWIFLLCR